jgi:hypothetical protein
MPRATELEFAKKAVKCRFGEFLHPVLTWYECEIFKKNTENIALAITLDKEPFRAPNPNIYGTAYFDSNGNLVRVQAKSKVKLTVN